MKKISRALAVLMLLCMLLSLMPAAAFAEGDTAENTEAQETELLSDDTEGYAEPIMTEAHEHQWQTSETEHSCQRPDCEYSPAQPHNFDHNTGACSVCGYSCLHPEWDESGRCTVCGKLRDPAAVIDGEEYASLAEAVDAMTEGCTVTVPDGTGRSVEAGGIDFTVSGTLELNGASLVNGASGGSITVSEANLTISGGTVETGIALDSAGLTLSGAAVTNASGNAIEAKNGSCSVTGGTVNGTVAVSGADLTVSGTAVSNAGGTALTVSSGSCTVNGGSYTGALTAEGGSIVINGGRFSSKDDAETFLAPGKGLVEADGMFIAADLTPINPDLSVILNEPVYENGLTAAHFSMTAADILEAMAEGTDALAGITVDPEYPVTVTFSMEITGKGYELDGENTIVSFSVTPTAAAVFNNGADAAQVRIYDSAIAAPITVNYSGVPSVPLSLEHIHGAPALDENLSAAMIYSGDTVSFSTVHFISDEDDDNDTNMFVLTYATPAQTVQELTVGDSTVTFTAGIGSARVTVAAAAASVDEARVQPGAENIIEVSGSYTFEPLYSAYLESVGIPSDSVIVHIPRSALERAAVDGILTVSSADTDGKGISVTFRNSSKDGSTALDQVLSRLGEGNDAVLLLSGSDDRTSFSCVMLPVPQDTLTVDLPATAPLCSSSLNDVFKDGDVIIRLDVGPGAVPYMVEHRYGSVVPGVVRGLRTENLYNSIDEAHNKPSDGNRLFTYADGIVTLSVQSFSSFKITRTQVTVSGSDSATVFLGDDNTLKFTARGEGKLKWTVDPETCPIEGMTYEVSPDTKTLTVKGIPTDESQKNMIFTIELMAEDGVGNSGTHTCDIRISDAVADARRSSGALIGDFETVQEAVDACTLPGSSVNLHKDSDEDVRLNRNVSALNGKGHSVDSLTLAAGILNGVTVTDLETGTVTAPAGASASLEDCTVTGTVESQGYVPGKTVEILSGSYGGLKGDPDEPAFTVSGGSFKALSDETGAKLNEFPAAWLYRNEDESPVVQYTAVKTEDGYTVKELVPEITACSNSRTYVKNTDGSLTFTTNIPYSIVEEYYTDGMETDADGHIVYLPGFSVRAGASGTTPVINREGLTYYYFSEDADGMLTVTLTNRYLKTKTSNTYYMVLLTDMGDTPREGGKYFVSYTGKTGDGSNIGLWLAIMAVCAAAAAAVIVVVKKKSGDTRKKDDKD